MEVLCVLYTEACQQNLWVPNTIASYETCEVLVFLSPQYKHLVVETSTCTSGVPYMYKQVAIVVCRYFLGNTIWQKHLYAHAVSNMCMRTCMHTHRYVCKRMGGLLLWASFPPLATV